MHLPLCRRRCPYCDFPIVVSEHYVPRIVQALCQELAWWHASLGTSLSVTSVYFGGGTPSFHAVRWLERIVNTIVKYFNLADSCEWTIECNPEDVSSAWIRQIRAFPFNRFSLGAQALRDEWLRWLGRLHTVRQIYRAVDLLFTLSDNVSIDWIFGLPDQTPDDLDLHLREIERMQLPHFSAYLLTIEENTVFGYWVRRGRLAIDEQRQADLLAYLHRIARTFGYEAYEISNFARAVRFQSRHNLLYWTCGNYLAVGPGAHSAWTVGEMRCRAANPAHPYRYLQAVANLNQRQHETLSATAWWNEWILGQVRQLTIPINRICRQDPWLYQHVQRALATCPQDWFCPDNDGNLRLSVRGILFSESILQALFLLPEETPEGWRFRLWQSA